MEISEVLDDDTPMESSLADLVLKPRSEKIRRPPNAFMLFARENRKIIARQHPDVSNKAVSTMLGKIWKDTDQSTKQKYFKKAKMLEDLHKMKYPNYVYSPREARIQKMNKRKMKDDKTSTFTANAVMKKSKNAMKPKEENEYKFQGNIKREEDWITSMEQDTSASPGYVPNNPEYFVQSPESDNENPPILEPCNQYSPEPIFQEEQTDISMSTNPGEPKKEVNFRWSMAAENCGCCSQEKLESKGLDNFPYARENRPIHQFPNPLHCSHSTPPPFWNTSSHFPGPMNSFYYGPAPCSSQLPRPYTPTFNPYWGSSMMNPHRFKRRDCFYDDMKPFPFPTPYHDPDFYGPPFGYFERPVAPHNRNPNYNFFPYLNENWDCLQQLPNEYEDDIPESHPCASRSIVKEKSLPNLYHYSSTSDERFCHQEENQSQVNEQNNKYPPFTSSIKPEYYTLSNNKDNQNNNLNSLCTGDKLKVQSLRKNVDSVSLTDFGSVEIVKKNDHVLSAQSQSSNPLIKDGMNEPCSSLQSDVNENIPSTEKGIINTKEQNYSIKMATKSDDIHHTPSMDSKGKDGNQKYANNILDVHTKNVTHTLTAEQDFMDTAELDLNKNSLRCMEQKGFRKTYYEQKDGTYVAEEKLNAIEKSMPCKLILNNSLIIKEEIANDKSCPQ